MFRSYFLFVIKFCIAPPHVYFFADTIQANNSFCDTKHEKSSPRLTERKCVLHVTTALKQTLLGGCRRNVKFCRYFFL